MNTKPIIHVGIALILLGIVAFTYQGGSDTSREKAVEIGSMQAGVDAMKTILISPLLGGLVLAGGIILVAVGIRKSA
ncbi:MAG: DUF3185 domain-containing protein [Candidatus Binatia bacterium]